MRIQTASLFLVLPLALSFVIAACGDKDGGDTGKSGGDTDTDTDTDGATDSGSGTDGGTDTDTDADTDTDTDTDGGTDTGGRPDTQTYAGDFMVKIFTPGSETPIDACVGGAEITTDPERDPVIMGTGQCSFRGDLSTVYKGFHSVEIDGAMLGGGSIAGGFDFDLDGNIIADDWTGSIVGTMMGSEFDGLVNLGGTNYAYQGGFGVSLVTAE